MANQRAGIIDQQLSVLFSEGTVAGLDDARLLERFVARRDEVAFAALVERHGPMVLAACRGLLGDAHKADDVFQATFLVLARRAGTIRHPDRLGAWLYGVAYHAASRAKRSESRRLRREREAAMSRAKSGRHVDPTLDHDAAEALHEEIGRLPERYRTLIVLCDLQGLVRTEVAQRLHWPLGTVNGRLSRARDLLRRRLAWRGVTLSVAGVGALAVPDSLAAATVEAAAGFASGVATATVAARGGLLAREVLRAMMLTKAMGAMFGIGILSLGLLGSSALVRQDAESNPAPERRVEAEAETKAPSSALDSLRAADIPAAERFPGQPANLVAVLGESRGRHGGAVRCLAITPDGKTVATGNTEDKEIKLWDAETLELRGKLVGHRSQVHGLAISPDGKTLVSGSSYGDFLVWDLRGETPKGPTQLTTRNHRTHAVAFSPDGKTLAIAGSGKGVELFDATGHSFRARTLLPGLTEEIRTLAFAPDGATLALGVVGDSSVRLWDIKANPPRERSTLLSAPPLGQRTSRPFSLAFAPDGKILAVVESNPESCVRLWDLSGPEPADSGRLEIGLSGMTGSQAQMVMFAPDGKSLYAGQGDGSVRIWDLRSGGLVERGIFYAHKGPVDVLAFSRDGKTLLTGGDDHLVRNWEVTAAVPREKVVPQGAVGGLRAVGFAPDGKTLAVGGDDQVVRLWSVAERRPEGQAAVTKSEFVTRAPVQALAFSPDGTTLACDDELWNVSGAEFARRGLLGSDDTIRSLAYAPDGKTLISGASGQKVGFWVMTAAAPRLRLTMGGDPPAPLNSGRPSPRGAPSVVAVSPDGKFLAFSGDDGSVRLSDLSGTEPREGATLKGMGWSVSALAFTPEGRTLAAGTNGGTRLWDLASEPPRILRSIQDCFGFSMAFSHDGTWLIAADQVRNTDKPFEPSHPAVCVYEVATGNRLYEWPLSASCWAIALAPDGRHVAAAKQDGLVDIYRLPLAR